MEEAVHLFRSRLDRHVNIYLLFIPILVFILVLTFFVSVRKGAQTASVATPDVLGEEAQP